MSDLCVITGGASGMGLAAARIVGRDRQVLICDIDEARLDAAHQELSAAGIDVTTATCDITDRESVGLLAEQAQELGRVASVIHSAGVSPSMTSAARILSINAIGTIYIDTAFYEIATPGMAIVNVASVAGHQMPGALAPTFFYGHALTDPDRFHREFAGFLKLLPGKMGAQLAYVLSKNFVIWYSKAIAAKFGAKGARVVSVSPGSFDTPMGKLEESAGAGALAELGALARFGRPEEIAELLAFCASEKPGYLTGADIICDGGVMAGMTAMDMIRLARANRPGHIRLDVCRDAQFCTLGRLSHVHVAGDS